MGYPLNSVEDVRSVCSMLDYMGVSWEWSGICVWLEGDFTPAKERGFEKLGFRWAKKRGQWFIRACDGLPKDLGAAA